MKKRRKIRKKNKKEDQNYSDALVILGRLKEDEKYLEKLSENILKQTGKECKVYYLSDRAYSNEEKMLKLLDKHFSEIEFRRRINTIERQWMCFKSMLINDNIDRVYVIGKNHKAQDFCKFLKGQETHKKPFYNAIPVWDTERTHNVFGYNKLEVQILETA